MTTIEALTLETPLPVLEELVAKVVSEIDELRSGLEYAHGLAESEPLSDALAGQLLVFSVGMEQSAGFLADEAKQLTALVEQIHSDEHSGADAAYLAQLAEWHEQRAQYFRGRNA